MNADAITGLLTLGLLAIPIAALAGVIGLIFGFRLHLDSPDATVAWDTARLLVRVHLFEPLATLPWMAIWANWYQHQRRGVLDDILLALWMTAPMLMLLSPWLPQARLSGPLDHLAAALRAFGTARYGLTLLLWLVLTLGTDGAAFLFLILLGTLLLWIDVLTIAHQVRRLDDWQGDTEGQAAPSGEGAG